MRICISANTSWNLFNFRLGLMKDLRKAGHEVIGLAPLDDSTRLIEKEDFKVIILKNLSRKGGNPIKDYQLLREYKSVIRSEKIDVIMLYTIKPVIYGNLALRNSKVISISTITGLGYTFLNSDYRSRAAKVLYKRALKYSSHIFFQNIDDKNHFEIEGLIKVGKAGVINGSGIDTKKIAPSQYTSGQSIVKFLFVGRILKDKGVVELISAYKELNVDSGAELLLIGPIDEDNPAKISKMELDELVFGTSIQYLGQRSDVLELMSNVDVVVLPSYREGVPRVLLEAMALARPIITTDVPGCREVIVDNRNGYICDSKSIESLKKAMNKMAELSTEHRLMMGENGRNLVEDKFDQSIISNIYIQLLKKIES